MNFFLFIFLTSFSVCFRTSMWSHTIHNLLRARDVHFATDNKSRVIFFIYYVCINKCVIIMKYLIIFLCLMTLSVIDASSFASRNKSLTADSLSIPWFLKVAPFFDLTKINGISPICQRDFRTFLSAMNRLELWALKSD